MKEKQMKPDDWNWVADSGDRVLVDFAVQCVDGVVAPQEFCSYLPETIDQWKFCFMDYNIYEHMYEFL